MDSMNVPVSTLQTSYYAVVAYKAELKKDLTTRYNNSPSFSNEDRLFLLDQIEKCKVAIEWYERSGIDIVRIRS